MPKSLKVNKKVITETKKEKVYCHEIYAQQVYNILTSFMPDNVGKDLSEGDVVSVVGYHYDEDTNKLIAELNGFVPVTIVNSDNEIKYFKYINIISSPSGLLIQWKFLGNSKPPTMPLDVSIHSIEPIITGSFYDAHLDKLHKQLKADIIECRNWYNAIVLERNDGGFMVDIGGIVAFLPGSLAAANKVVNFESFINKEIPVMIESYQPDTDTYVVSNKKCIHHILLPAAIKSLDKDKLYTATITGTTPFGIFLEFENVLTGLMHVSEMSDLTREKFMEGGYYQGDVLEVWIKEISDTNKITLTEIDLITRDEIQDLKLSLEGVILEAVVKVVLEYGVVFDLGDGLTGLLPKHELKQLRIHPNYKMAVCVQEINPKTGKILLSKAPRYKEIKKV